MRPVRSTTATPPGAGTAATGTRSTMVIVTVPGQWRLTWARRIPGTACRRVAAPPSSTSTIAMPVCTPASAEIDAGVLRVAPMTCT